MGIELHRFQNEGRDYLVSHPRALLADEMGLGKTVQAIAALSIVLGSNDHALVICPASLRLNWIAEIKRFNPAILDKVTVASYEMFQKGSFKDLKVLIVDEAHYLKNPQAKRTKAVLSLAMGIEHTWFLSGTPITSTTVDSFTLFSFIAPEHFPITFKAFAETYSYPFATTYGWNYSRPKNLVQLHELGKQHVFLRRTKSQVLTQLPPKVYSKSYIEITQKDREEIERLSVGVVAEELDKSSSHSVTLRRYLAITKAIPTAEIINNILAEKSKVVVFAYFKQAIEALEKKLRHTHGADAVVTLTGSDNSVHRHSAVTAFQENPKVKVFLGNIIAAGTGITLTAADTVIFLERDWTPANNLQAEDRIHRIGQSQVAQIIDVIVPDTIDEAVQGVLLSKQKTIKGAIDGQFTVRTQRESAQVIERVSVGQALQLPWEL